MSTVDLHWPALSRATRPLLRTGGVAGLLMLPVFAATVAVLTWAEWKFSARSGLDRPACARRQLPERPRAWRSRAGPGAELRGAGPAGGPVRARAVHGLLHGIGFVLLLLGNLVAFVAAGLALRGAPGWGRLWAYSVSNAPAAILVTVVLAPLDQVSFYALLVVLLAYYGVLGLRMHRLAARTSVE